MHLNLSTPTLVVLRGLLVTRVLALVERHDGRVGEEKPEVLERLGREEGLHLVGVARRAHRHVFEARVAAAAHAAVLLEGLEDLPPPPPRSITF